MFDSHWAMYCRNKARRVMRSACATMQALKKENEASQIHLQQMEDARMAVRQKALQQYLLTAQAMDMDFAAPQV